MEQNEGRSTPCSLLPAPRSMCRSARGTYLEKSTTAVRFLLIQTGRGVG